MEDSGALPVGGCGGWVCLVVDGRPACVCARAGGVWWVCLVRMASLCLVGGGMVGGRSVGVGGRPSVCGVCCRPSVWVSVGCVVGVWPAGVAGGGLDMAGRCGRWAMWCVGRPTGW